MAALQRFKIALSPPALRRSLGNYFPSISKAMTLITHLGLGCAQPHLFDQRRKDEAVHLISPMQTSDAPSNGRKPAKRQLLELCASCDASLKIPGIADAMQCVAPLSARRTTAVLGFAF